MSFSSSSRHHHRFFFLYLSLVLLSPLPSLPPPLTILSSFCSLTSYPPLATRSRMMSLHITGQRCLRVIDT